jgi:hypothetical protein
MWPFGEWSTPPCSASISLRFRRSYGSSLVIVASASGVCCYGLEFFVMMRARKVKNKSVESRRHCGARPVISKTGQL